MELQIARQVMEVSLKAADKHAGLAAERIDRVLEGVAQQRLARVEQIETEVRALSLFQDVLDQPHLVTSISRPERDHIETDRSENLCHALRHRAVWHLVAKRSGVAWTVAELNPVICAFVIEIHVGLFDRSTVAVSCWASSEIICTESNPGDTYQFGASRWPCSRLLEVAVISDGTSRSSGIVQSASSVFWKSLQSRFELPHQALGQPGVLRQLRLGQPCLVTMLAKHVSKSPCSSVSPTGEK